MLVATRGEYVVENYGGIVFDVSAVDDGLVIDEGTFHSPTANGPFQLVVPRGVDNLHVRFHQHTYDGNDRYTEAVVVGVIDDDRDVGTVDLP